MTNSRSAPKNFFFFFENVHSELALASANFQFLNFFSEPTPPLIYAFSYPSYYGGAEIKWGGLKFKSFQGEEVRNFNFEAKKGQKGGV